MSEPEPNGLNDVASAVDAATVAVPPKPAPRRGGFMSTALGGVVAAAAGFGLAQYVPLSAPAAPDLSAIQTTLDAQAAQIKDLSDKLAEIAAATDRVAAQEVAAPVDVSPLQKAISEVEARVAGMEAAAASAPTTAVGGGVSSAELAALRAEVAALKSSGGAVPLEVEDLVQKTEARLAAAEAAAEGLIANAKAVGALARVQTAIDNGAPFAAALQDLGDDVPAPLLASAAAGVPTLRGLQAGFPDAARAALEASLRANMGESWSDRVASFLKSQTGARSTEPREGPDPDAVLSRAEFALGSGDVPTAIATLAELPPEGQTAMTEWVALAKQRIEAELALTDLSAKLGQ